MEQLRRLAASRGVSPGSLAVDWVLERLDQEDTETVVTVIAPAAARTAPDSRVGMRSAGSRSENTWADPNRPVDGPATASGASAAR